jgi:hypothetical protein
VPVCYFKVAFKAAYPITPLQNVTVCCSKIAEAEAAVSVNEKNWQNVTVWDNLRLHPGHAMCPATPARLAASDCVRCIQQF